MLFVILTLVVILALIFVLGGNEKLEDFISEKINIDISFPSLIIGVIAIFYICIYTIMHIVVGINNISYYLPSAKEGIQTKYEQLQKHKDNKYLAENIIDWNINVEMAQKYSKDFWVGPYYSDVLAEFDVIE